jgi:mannosidase alpha-like ER degradation enhancer 1
MLGGLISGHLLALDHYGSLIPGGYKNELLQLANDLGQRLMPSFDTPTGIPYAWINLKVSYYIPGFHVIF